MSLPNESVLLRIFIGESDRWEHKPLYEALVLAAREAKLAGATVLRGPMGFGKSSRVHTTKILQLSTPRSAIPPRQCLSALPNCRQRRDEKGCGDVGQWTSKKPLAR